MPDSAGATLAVGAVVTFRTVPAGRTVGTARAGWAVGVAVGEAKANKGAATRTDHVARAVYVRP